MAEELFIEMECAQFTKTGQAACGDDGRFLTVEKENRYIAALSDGLGSGVKAHVLSNMTTTMALRFLQSNLPTLESVEIIMDSLPVCEVRKISYATFSLFDFALGGRAKILEMGNPGYIHLRGTEEVEYDLVRAKITVNRIESGMLTEDVGYIYLYEFAGNCATEFQAAVNSLESKGAKGLIIDLRDNPGGWVDDAEAIGDIFLDKGTLCYLQYNDGSREYYYTKAGKKDMKLVVLMNEHSASSSEILAGALKDRADATIVGVQSYGKGIVQTVVGLDDGAGMQMTIAQYYTPNGNAVHKVGITPDVEVHLPDGDNGMYEFGDLNDAQLAKALEVMQQKLAK